MHRRPLNGARRASIHENQWQLTACSVTPHQDPAGKFLIRYRSSAAAVVATWIRKTWVYRLKRSSSGRLSSIAPRRGPISILNPRPPHCMNAKRRVFFTPSDAGTLENPSRAKQPTSIVSSPLPPAIPDDSPPSKITHGAAAGQIQNRPAPCCSSTGSR